MRIFSKVHFLGHMISAEGIHVNPTYTKTIDQWPPLKNVKELQSFLGLCNYYRRFVKNFSHIAQPLTALLKKECTWRWTDQAKEAFETLKYQLVHAPVLRSPDPEKTFVVT